MARRNLTALSRLTLLAVAVLTGCAAAPPEPLTALPSHQLELLTPPAVPKVDKPDAPRPETTQQSQWDVKDGRPWRYVVIHHSDSDFGNAEVFDAWHRSRGFDELGYHFVITNGRGAGDGQVQVGSRWTKQKWGAHTGGTPDNEYNNFGIGICVVGTFGSQSPSAAQLESLRRLTLYLARKYHIAPENVIGHRDAPNARTDCPGDELYEHLNNTLRPYLMRQLLKPQ